MLGLNLLSLHQSCAQSTLAPRTLVSTRKRGSFTTVVLSLRSATLIFRGWLVTVADLLAPCLGTRPKWVWWLPLLHILSKPQLNHNSIQSYITLVGLVTKMTLHTTTTTTPQKLNVSNISAVPQSILMKL